MRRLLLIADKQTNKKHTATNSVVPEQNLTPETSGCQVILSLFQTIQDLDLHLLSI